MIRNVRRAGSAALLIGWLVVGGPVRGQTSGVKDEAGFFSADAVARANAAIKELKNGYHKDLLVETFKSVPADRQARFQGLNATGKSKFLADWANARAATLGVKGIYVHVFKNPGHLEVVVDKPTLARAFPAADRDKLRDALLAGFKARAYDKALADAVALVRQRFEQNLGPPGPVANAVRDYAGLFSADAVARADRAIKDFHQRFHTDLLVETFPAPPPDKRRQVEGLDAAGRSKFFADWLQERSRAGKIDGIHVLICKQPTQIQVGVSEKTRAKAFPTDDRDKLVALLVSEFKARQFDRGLARALAQVSDTVDRNLIGAPPVPIKDEARYFSAAAVEKGNATIRDIRRRFHKDVLIETFPQVPAERSRGIDMNDKEARRKLFSAWAADRQKEAGRDGINVLICKDPMSLEVAAGPQTGQNAFPAANRAKLAEVLLARFNNKDHDGGLADGLAYITETLAKNLQASAVKAPVKSGGTTAVAANKSPLPVTPDAAKTPEKAGAGAPTSPSKEQGLKFDPMWIVWGILILLGLWIVIGVVRALLGHGRPAAYPRQGPLPDYPPQQGPYGGHQPPAAGQAPYGAGHGAGRPPQAGPPPGYGGPPAGYGGPPPGYGGPPPGYAAPPPPAGGGMGGFLPGLLGGMFGGAAGGWIYDRFGRRSEPSAHASSGPAAPPAPAPRPPTSSPNKEADYSGTGRDADQPAREYSSSGGDFGDEPRPDKGGYASSGGDFGDESAPATSGGDFGETAAPAKDFGGGGDFGEPAPAAGEGFGGGGDFGTPASEGDGGGGGDFGEPQEAESGGGGDFGEPQETTSGGGGDFGNEPSEPAGGESSGGDFGNSADSGDGGATDSSGGDSGGASW